MKTPFLLFNLENKKSYFIYTTTPWSSKPLCTHICLYFIQKTCLIKDGRLSKCSKDKIKIIKSINLYKLYLKILFKWHDTHVISFYLLMTKHREILMQPAHYLYMGMCIKGLFWPPLDPKTESGFSPISSYWFIRRIAQV